MGMERLLTRREASRGALSRQGTVATTRRTVSPVALGLFAALALVAPADARDASLDIRQIDVPGAGTAAGQGTYGYALNGRGEVAGFYADANSVYHGFLRDCDGVITTFDPPNSQSTFVAGLNDEGEITGYFNDASGVVHGYVRAFDGKITSFDAPGAGTSGGGLYQGTFGYNVDNLGTVLGTYVDANNVSHGFLRARDGRFETFDAPKAGTAAGQGTFVTTIDGLTPESAVGWTVDTNGVLHGYLRSSEGRFTTFDAPGAGTGSGQGTEVSGVNGEGTVLGITLDASNAYLGFFRSPDGRFTAVDVPGAGTADGQGTQPQNIIAGGTIVGVIVDANDAYHGFLRAPDGHLTAVNAPGAGTAPGQGTLPTSNNSAGEIAGFFIDANNVFHGFLQK